MSEHRAAYLSSPKEQAILQAAAKVVSGLMMSAAISADYKSGPLVFSVGLAVEPVPPEPQDSPSAERFACFASLGLRYPCSADGVGTWNENCRREIARSEFTVVVPPASTVPLSPVSCPLSPDITHT